MWVRCYGFLLRYMIKTFSSLVGGGETERPFCVHSPLRAMNFFSSEELDSDESLVVLPPRGFLYHFL